MIPSKIRSAVVTERISWIREMTRAVKALPLESFEVFIDDSRNTASAESYLRRGIEALLDLGRHVLAKGFAVAVTEYKEIANSLHREGIISREHADLMRQIAGYRNRMVHFYGEITNEELYRLCTRNLKDIETILDALVNWLRNNPERLDEQI